MERYFEKLRNAARGNQHGVTRDNEPATAKPVDSQIRTSPYEGIKIGKALSENGWIRLAMSIRAKQGQEECALIHERQVGKERHTG
jgi:hypothetical protein